MTDILAVSRSLDRILKIGGKRYKLTAEDWASDYQCEEAASLCAVAVNHADAEAADTLTFEMTLPLFERLLGILARAKLGVDDTRPFGFNIIVQPIE